VRLLVLSMHVLVLVLRHKQCQGGLLMLMLVRLLVSVNSKH